MDLGWLPGDNDRHMAVPSSNFFYNASAALVCFIYI